MSKSVSPVKKSSVHFILQGKGGVGKSLISSFLAQYFTIDQSNNVFCFDTDPVNQTLASYKALKVENIKIMDGSKINERNFDKLMEKLITEEGTFIVDNGASSFVPLSNYIVENNAIEAIQESGKDVYIHCVITGGQALLETLKGFKALVDQTGTRNIVVWLNEFFGPIQEDQDDNKGKTFEEMKVYTNNSDKIRGIVKIHARNPDTFGKDMQEMLSRKMIFKEVIENSNFSIMSKQRMKTVQRSLNDQIEMIGL